ncbi:MATE family efflux transporter [Aestuariibacter salexigens]|uniref:MATE family efflux transporter n=1 Tax=Aestuariibacter salexigens TaxID=226010 RepID=UPI000424AE54|nr:MATE family efflux transporter [Aestuariibacter salexigens]
MSQVLTEIKKLSNIAWPLLAAQVMQTLMGVSDTIMAGRYSAVDMAAVAVGFSITMPVLFFLQGILLALAPIVSRLHGAKKSGDIPYAFQQCVYTALPLGLFALGLSAAVPWLFSLIDMEPTLRDITVRYTQFILYGTPAFIAYQALRNLCEGLSITMPSMLIMLLGLLVNIPANYILIYGKLGLPALGGAGCGIATSLVFLAMACAFAVYVVRAPALNAFSFFRPWSRPSWSTMRETYAVGVPIAFTIFFEVTLFGVVALLLSPFGATVVAAHQVALNFSSLMFMLPLSIGMAATIRVGYLLGEVGLPGSRVAIRSALLIGIVIAVASAVLTILLRYPIASLYTENNEVIELAATLMLMAALFQFSDAIQVISAGLLRGFKDTKAMFYLTFISYWLVGLPTGCILALTDWVVSPMQAKGFWIGFIVGLSTAAVLLGLRLLYVQRHTHSEKEVGHEVA